MFRGPEERQCSEKFQGIRRLKWKAVQSRKRNVENPGISREI